MGLLISLARYGGCDLKSAGQAHSLYSRCLGYALPMVLSTNFPCSQWALIPNEGDGYEKYFKNKQGIITVYFNNPLFSNKVTVSAILVALYFILFVAFITNTFLIFFQVF